MTAETRPRTKLDGERNGGPTSTRRYRSAAPQAPFAREIGRTRYVVLMAVGAVVVVSLALFVLGTVQAAITIWNTVQSVAGGRLGTTDLTVQYLEIVSVMLKAVIFYIIGVGLYSLFIGPLNITSALGVETFNDLESKVVSVIVVIMGVTFLEHFIMWQNPTETLMFGGTLALVVVALVLFQWHSHRAREEQQQHAPDTQARAKRELFHEDREVREVLPDEIEGSSHRDGETGAGDGSGRERSEATRASST